MAQYDNTALVEEGALAGHKAYATAGRSFFVKAEFEIMLREEHLANDISTDKNWQAQDASKAPTRIPAPLINLR